MGVRKSIPGSDVSPVFLKYKQGLAVETKDRSKPIFYSP